MDERFFSTVAFDPVSALNLKGLNHQGCNGVLVASNLVLTSAHCVCTPGHGEPGRFDGAGCAAKVTVRVDYEAKVQAPARDDYMGEPGSPWVRRAKQEIELVGISQCGLGLTPTLTRITPYREWLEEQIRVASGKH